MKQKDTKPRTSGVASAARADTTIRKIRKAVEKTAGKKTDRSGTSILLHSDSKNLHILARADENAPDAFHIASVGKLFTTVLIGRLIDAGKLSFDHSVAALLPADTMDGLFVVDGTDYQKEVTIRHLLSHTSGAADYYEDKGVRGKSVAELMTADPERRWSPQDLLDFSRRGQKAVGSPGEKYHYSDTGFILLGLVVEQLYEMSFHEVLKREILVPLEMERTWMPFRSRPAKGPAVMRRAWIGGSEISTAPSITADWSGGGIASTEEDLLLFSKALWTGNLLSRKTREELLHFDHKFHHAIYYGLGVMEYRISKIFFLMRGYPDMLGHMGVLGTHLFYSPEYDIHVVASVGSDAAVGKSVQLMVKALGAVAG